MKLASVRKAFGQTVKAERTRRGLSQANMAEMLGCSAPNFTNIENGHHGVSLEQALVLSRLLGFQLDRIPLSIKIVEAKASKSEALREQE